MQQHRIRRGLVGAAIVAGTIGTIGGTAAAANHHGNGFALNQQKLEQQLAERATQLQRLTADVTNSKTLDPTHASVLTARLTSETSSISGLIAKVPTDTTQAQLNADRQAMLQDNRVYAVMSPQVFETISADAAMSQLVVLQAEEPQLAGEVASIVGQPGYKNALRHDQNFVVRIANQTAALTTVVTNVLAQQPSNYPGDQSFFAHANVRIRDANVAIAYANYDASVIALATGGYTGS